MNKFVKRITAVLLVVILVVGSSVGLMAAEPVRQTFEAAGATVTWDDYNRLIVIEIVGNTIVLEPNSNIALVNDVTLPLGSPVFIEDDLAFIELDDLTAISLALVSADSVEGEHGTAVATAQALAAQFMELANVSDFSLAIVNANTGFSWTSTTSDTTDADTIFHLGSIAKTFTAVAVMQLVEQGLVDLDTPIVEYIPEFRTNPSASGEGNYRNITARMLLSHTAGIYVNDFGSGAITYGSHYQRYMNEFLDRFANTSMVREEGTAYEYANTGFVLLGILVARLAGHENYFEGFNQFMLDNVFEPMGLTRTSFVVTDELRPYVAGVYTMAGMPQQFQYWNVLPTGTMFTTANEMVSLMTMFLNDGYYNGRQILTPQSVELMFTDQTGTGHYGLGIAFMGDPAGSGFTAVGHNGGMVYNFSAMFVDRKHGIGAFAASNNTASQGLNEVLAGMVLGTAIAEVGGQPTPPVSHIDPEAVPIELTAEEMEALAGLYLISGGMSHLFIDLVEGQLYLRIPAQDLILALTPMSDGHFSTEIGIPFWLVSDNDGNVTLAQGENKYAIAGERVDTAQFIPDEDFMENWYSFMFKAQGEQDFYVFLIPSLVFGVNEDGFAYSDNVLINMPPDMTLVMLERMDSGIELHYEDGEYFFNYWGIRFVRQ